VRSFIGASTLKGWRPEQQDSHCFTRLEDYLVVVVTDGMGGEGGKELSRVASDKAVSEACVALSRLQEKDSLCEKKLKYLGLKALKKASGRVSHAKKNNEWETPGTTITLIIVTPELIGTFWIGDSPAYQYENGKLIPLIIPHTRAEELIKEGKPRESVSQQPQLNCMLIQCLGHKADNPGANIRKHDGDCMCIIGSDGFLDYVPLEDIEGFINAGFATSGIQHVTENLVRKALDYGSCDNVTAVMFSYENSKVERRSTRYF